MWWWWWSWLLSRTQKGRVRDSTRRILKPYRGCCGRGCRCCLQQTQNSKDSVNIIESKPYRCSRGGGGCGRLEDSNNNHGIPTRIIYRGGGCCRGRGGVSGGGGSGSGG